MILTLIGYRATGKTTLAKLLGQQLGWTWMDSDELIESRTGKTIARIFAEDGEPSFRDFEAQVIAELCGHDQFVLAAGGGAPLREDNRKLMRQSGKVVWLTARPDTILQRMSADASTNQRRPNLTHHEPLKEIVELLARRDPIYRETADYIIDTENRTPEALCAEILDSLKLK